MARLRIHRRAAPLGGGTLWPRPWKWRARSGRVLRHRIEESESPRNRWRRPLLCRIALRISIDELKKGVAEKSADRSDNLARIASLSFRRDGNSRRVCPSEWELRTNWQDVPR